MRLRCWACWSLPRVAWAICSEFFGVEAGVEAPFSPSHLALGIGLGLITTVALRGTTWSIHLWTGVIVEAGLAGCC